jgi:Zn-dependent protease with chaperone function
VRLLVYLPLLIPALAAVAARPLAARLEPRQGTWLLTVTAVALAGCSTVALALLAALAIAQVPVLADLGHYSQSVIHHHDPTSAITGAVAAVVLTVAAVAVAVAFRHRARALAESYRRAARLHDDGTVVVQRGAAVEAYALPGWPGRIVVSGRLLEALDEPGRAALLAHERAHLAGRHHLFTTVAHLAAAANPVLLPIARAVDYTVERWADEHAARVTGDRRLVAVTIGRVAMLATPGRLPAATLGMVRAGSRRVSLAWAGPVPRRVAALLGPPPRSRMLLLAAAVLIVLLTGASAVEAAKDLHALFELAQAGH